MIRQSGIQIPFRYAAGRGASLFLTALRDEGRILGAPCPACQRVLCPAPSFCPRCGEVTGEPVEVGPRGRVICHTEVSGRVFGLIKLDGADGAMLHRLIDPGSGGFCAGARVQARLAGRRVGSILDIEGFEGVEEETE